MDSKKIKIKLGGAVRRSKKRTSPQTANYRKFLKGDETPQRKKKKSPSRGDIRIIKVDKDAKQVDTSKVSPQKDKVDKPNVDKPKVDKPNVDKPNVDKPKVDKPVAIPNVKKQPLRRTASRRRVSRNNKRSTKRVSTKKGLHKRFTNNRKVSLKCVPYDKKKDVNKVLESIKKMSDKSIKEKLLENGIIIKSNKKQLLRDMYVFSELGGIKIHKE